MKFDIVDLVDPPSKPYMSVFPKEGKAYDYRFVQEETGRWESWAVDVAAAEPIPKVTTHGHGLWKMTSQNLTKIKDKSHHRQ